MCKQGYHGYRTPGGAGILILVLILAAHVSGDDLTLVPNIDPARLVADKFVLLSKSVLRGRTPRPEQLEMAGILLDQALNLDPQDANLWRLQLELDKQVGDRKLRLNALQHYYNLNPSDDAAQLELIMALIESRQTLEQRVAGVQHILDSTRSASYSKALRSRLASYVAQGAGEIGDMKRFGKYLSLALELGPTNKQAAQMAYEYAADHRSSSALALGNAVILVLGADPFDADARVKLARLLLAQGLYSQANEQFALGHSIVNQLDQVDVVFDWCLSLAASREFDSALSLLGAWQLIRNKIATEAKQQSAGQGEVAVRDKQQPGDQELSEPTPPDSPVLAVRLDLPIDLEWLRLAIFHEAGYTSRVDGALGRIRNQLTQENDLAAEADRVWLSVLFDRHDEQEQGRLAKLAEAEDRDESWLARVRGWLALNHDLKRKARDLLEPVADLDPYARYGLALSQDKSDQQKKIDLLQQVVAGSYRDMAAMLAAMQLNKIGVAPKPTPAGARLLMTYEQWSPTLRHPDPVNKPLIRMDLTLNGHSYAYLDPIIATLRIQNATEVPLALAGAIPSDLLLIATPQRGGRTVDLPPQVVDMRRRLVLASGASLQVTVRMDRGALGDFLSRVAAERIGFNVSALLDPSPVPGERLGVGPLGAVDSEVFIERRASPLTTDNFHLWLDDVQSPDPIDRLKSLARLALFGPGLSKSDNEQLKELSDKVSQSLNSLFGQLPAYEQAWVFFFLAPTETSTAMFGNVYAAARLSDDPLVRISYLITQVSDPESADLDAAQRHEQPIIQRFAQLQRQFIIKNRQAREQAAEQRRSQDR